MTRGEVFERITEIGVVPAIRPSKPSEAIYAAEAISRGGIPIVEISMAMPESLECLTSVTKAHGGKVLAGAGTVLDGEGVRLAYEAGAQFIVTPGFSEDAVRMAQAFELPIFAGALTPTEVQVALKSGADAVKLFPCYSAGGPRYIKSLLTQYPDAQFIASGGVTLENCMDYIRAGACAVGVGREIGDAESMASGAHRLFAERARRFRKAVSEAQMLWLNARAQAAV